MPGRVRIGRIQLALRLLNGHHEMRREGYLQILLHRFCGMEYVSSNFRGSALDSQQPEDKKQVCDRVPVPFTVLIREAFDQKIRSFCRRSNLLIMEERNNGFPLKAMRPSVQCPLFSLNDVNREHIAWDLHPYRRYNRGHFPI